ncbi:MAG: hypothetical protein A2X05_11610 [Bacteroidetes bacterium GWE2_41_25]|nr:MAG: hypothetical protein A2X03_09730 [Bacteroidetes bacterium GWA2_40_15]OFX90355.1 MAG: hypothetical protein A2X06_11560 [Bacteroidetes bacterium GWC2_40_22]OFY03638.1 MAG: hypothetical protein A2X05_11610 [Bacteroidetes bacterium GWE2_41_25]OFY59976.1 MAG: hypothetical protein A2X04_06030 [Bacteroidetes bacterium GWF2_41_9]HBH84944.1 DUF4290 domain-containing protein [Bacteroidales bacterium]
MNYDYNTQRKRMALPEYGRNVQKMVDHIRTIKDRDERNRAAKTIIQIMGNLNPHLRDIGDFKHKLWDHLAIIADFELDIDSPYPVPEVSKLIEKPNQIPYMQGNIRFLHYGRIIAMMIEAATELEEGEEKEYLTTLIVNQMKKSYVTWNRSQVADEVIINDMKVLSKGKLKMTDGVRILEVRELLPQVRKKPQGKPHGKPQNKQYIKKKGFSRH